ncbi:MAG: hypothetical protein WCC92_20530 [Candidatus Korobacteraceae bacterium]
MASRSANLCLTVLQFIQLLLRSLVGNGQLLDLGLLARDGTPVPG